MDYQAGDIVAVIGVGTTGLSIIDFLSKYPVSIVAMDDRDNPPGKEQLASRYPQVITHFGSFDETQLRRAKQIVVSPGVPLTEPAIASCAAAGISVVGDIELFLQQVRAPIVAITGTNGKTTVTTLMGEMFKDAGVATVVGGNIGTPALDLLKQPTPEIYVLELSSFQLETTFSLRAKAATILNITPDHMDRYDTVADYAQAKQRIYDSCEWAIYNLDDAATKPQVAVAHTSTFTLNTPSENAFGVIRDQQQFFLAFGSEKIIACDELKLKGQQNWANALAALALGKAAGLSLESMAKTLRNFSGLPHRCQHVRQRAQINWYNDSKGTNVGATTAALSGINAVCRNKIILIAGGMAKNADFAPLADVMNDKIRCVILYGKDAQYIADALQHSVQLIRAQDLPHAINIADEQAQQGDDVLFSPACASFDMFRDFNHRGEVFMQLVRDLP